MAHYLDNPKGQAVNGIWELASPKFRDFWRRGKICRQVFSSIPPHTNVVPTRTRPRARPLTQVRDPFFADFLSLDVEGAELQVLESLDFRRSAFGIVLVEADTGNGSKNEGVRRVLVENG